MEGLIDVNRTTLVIGDLNICYRENYSNKLVQGLLTMGFKQYMQDPTHIQGRVIDHVYFLDLRHEKEVVVERYSPYYSDHDAMCITIALPLFWENQKINFAMRFSGYACSH